MKVKNCSDRPVPIGRRCIPSYGVEEVEDTYLFQPRIIRLKDRGILEFPYDPKKEVELEELAQREDVVVEGNKVILSVDTDVPSPQNVVAIEPKSEPDDLTVLVHIGTSRAKKLAEKYVETFEQLIYLGVEGIDSMLDITRDQAEEVIEDAKEKIG